MTRPRILIAVLALSAALLACSYLPAATPTTPDLDEIVSQTMQALTSAPQPNSTPKTPTQAASPLPHSLHFLNTDAAAHLQVFRLERDGRTLAQITAEPADVEYYDVNQQD